MKYAGQVRFVKISKGFVRLKDGRVVRPGQTFWAYPEDIPDAFRSGFETAEKQPEELYADYGITESTQTSFRMVHVGFGRYDITDTFGKVLNEKRLTKVDALQMIDELERQ